MEKNVEYRDDGSLAIKAGEVRLEDPDGKKVENDLQDEEVIVVPEEFLAEAFEEDNCGQGHAIEWQDGIQYLGVNYRGPQPYIVGGCVRCGRAFHSEVKVK